MAEAKEERGNTVLILSECGELEARSHSSRVVGGRNTVTWVWDLPQTNVRGGEIRVKQAADKGHE